MSNLFRLEDFEWQDEGIRLHIREAEVGSDRVFYISFSDKRKPLVLTRMKSYAGMIWTSIPAGRKETEDIGAIIEAHFKGELIMCYYNGQKVSRAEFIRLMDLEKAVVNYDFLDKDIHDGFSYGNIAVIKPTADKCNFDIVQMEWGFIPPYTKNRDAVDKMRFGYKDSTGKWHQPYTTLNAKGEELLYVDPNTGKEKMFRKAALERRCLILSSEFYEWQHIYPTNKRTGEPLKTAKKYPYHIGLKDKEYFFIAAIWQNWTDKDTGETVDTVALVTTEANSLMRQIHNSKNRMPTMLPDELAWEWMMGDLSEERITELATYQISAKEMEAYTIEKDFKTSGTPGKAFVYAEVPELQYEV